MKMRYRIYFLGLLAFCNMTLSSCQKYLDKSSNNQLTIPSTLNDYQQLLDNEGAINQYTSPSLGDMGSDDLFLTYGGWQSQYPYVQNSYIWAKDIFAGQTSYDWDNMYQAVYYANIVLDGLQKVVVNPGNQADFNRIKGSALFYRAFTFYNLEETFGEPYRPQSAQTDLGIPLRLNANLDEKLERVSVKNVYAQIDNDLLEAKNLLPSTTDFSSTNRPSKAVAYACLARAYLTQQDYPKALTYSDSSLKLYGTLTDYNNVDLNQRYTFRIRIPEVMYDCSAGTGSLGIWIADSSLYRQYDANDLRRTAFFRTSLNRLAFKGSYSKDSPSGFNGFATDEMYLVRAECNARLGNVSLSMNDLNTLLQNRWKTGTFVPFTAANPADALKLILIERRKELLFRGLRWADLRRLNQDSQTAVTLTRELNGTVYTLSPNDPRYTYPIPPDEIALSGIKQNNR